MNKKPRKDKGSYKKYSKYNRMLDPKYAKFRKCVLARDSYTCQFPSCNKTSNLEIHHIKLYSKYPKLRTSFYNGITLCKSCHKKVTGCEPKYESIFFRINASKEKNSYLDKDKNPMKSYSRSKRKKKCAHRRKYNSRHKRS